MTILVLVSVLAIVGYVLANLRWQVWDAQRRIDRITSRRLRERIAEYR